MFSSLIQASAMPCSVYSSKVFDCLFHLHQRVVLPDVLIDEFSCDLHKENLAEMLRLFDGHGQSQIMVEPVPMEQVDSYGVADVNGHKLKPGTSAKMTEVVEKPPVDEAPSNLAVVGRYVLSAAIWDFY